jgi:hypothetical protein
MRKKSTKELVESMLKVRAKGTNSWKYFDHEYVVDNVVDIRDAFRALMDRLHFEVELVDKKCLIVEKPYKRFIVRLKKDGQ